MNTTRSESLEARRATSKARTVRGFVSGTVIGGLGGAEFHLPLLVGHFRPATLEAVILNKAMSLVVAFALLFVTHAIPFGQTLAHLDIVANLLSAAPADLLIAGLGLILLISAVKVFAHAHE